MNKHHERAAGFPSVPTISSMLRATACLLPGLLAAQPAVGQGCDISGDDWDNIQLFRRCLTERGVDQWNAADGETVLHSAAAWTNNPTIIVLLLDAGADPNARADNGQTPLHYGAWNANPVVTQHLLAAGADPSAASNLGYTPLHEATGNENERVAKLLLDAGGDPNAVSNDGWTPFHSAVFYGSAVAAFLEAGIDVGLTSLQLSVLEGNSRAVDSLLADGVDPSNTDDFGWTALHYAVSIGERPMASRFLAAGVDPNARSENGLAALHLAADPTVVELLAGTGGDVDARNDLGRTPLHQAALFREVAVIEALIDVGADRQLRDSNGERPIDLAERNGRIEENDRVLRRLGGGGSTAEPHRFTSISPRGTAGTGAFPCPDSS